MGERDNKKDTGTELEREGGRERGAGAGRAVAGIEAGGCLKLINRPVRVRDSWARQRGPSPWHVMLIGFVLGVCAGGADIKIK